MKKYIYILFAMVAIISCSEDNNRFIEQSLFGQGSYEIPLPLPTEPVLSFEGSLAYGTVLNSTSNPRQVIVNNTFNHPVNVSVSHQISASPLSFSEANFQVPANGSYTLTVTYNPTGTSFLSGSVKFSYNANQPNSTGPIIQNVPVSGNSVAVLPTTMTYSPSGTINFGTIARGDTATQTITLVNSGNATANWSSTTVGGRSIIPFSGTISAGASQNVILSYTTSSLSSNTGNFLVSYNSSGNALSIPFSSNIVAPNRIISLSVNSTSFGNVQVNTTATKTITISNLSSSNSALTITGVSENSSHYSVTNFTGVLQPGQSTQVIISFTPTSVGIKSTTLNVFSNKTSGSSAINFTGTGVN